MSPRRPALAVLLGSFLYLSGCGRPAHPGGVEVQSNAACASCHMADYERTAMGGGPYAPDGNLPAGTGAPDHIYEGFPTTCADCHNTSSWLGAVLRHPAAVEPLFPIGPGSPHTKIYCRNCHDTSVGPSYASNANCTARCHTASNTTGFSSTAVPETVGKHNGATFDSTNIAFCRTCHPSGQDATAIMDAGGNLTATGLASHSYSSTHQGASCTQCHNAALAPADSTGIGDHSQDVDCTGSCHTAANTGGFHPSTTITAGSDGAILPQSVINVASTTGFGVQGTSGRFSISTASGIQEFTYLTAGMTSTAFGDVAGVSGRWVNGSTLHLGDAIIPGHNGAGAWGYQRNGAPVPTDHEFCIQCHSH